RESAIWRHDVLPVLPLRLRQIFVQALDGVADAHDKSGIFRGDRAPHLLVHAWAGFACAITDNHEAEVVGWGEGQQTNQGDQGNRTRGKGELAHRRLRLLYRTKRMRPSRDSAAATSSKRAAFRTVAGAETVTW